MTDFVEMTDLPVISASAAASLSVADINLSGLQTRKNRNKISLGNWILSVLILLIVLFGMTTGWLAMITERSMACYAAFVVPLITGPWILIQRSKLQWMPSLREEAKQLRGMVAKLVQRRLQLQSEIHLMEGECQKLVQLENRFREKVMHEGESVQVCRDIIRQNSQIQKAIKKANDTRDLQDLLSIILLTDRNQNNRVGAEEIEELIHRLRAFADGRGKIFDEAFIRRAILQRSIDDPYHSACNYSVFNLVQCAMFVKESKTHDEEQGDIQKEEEESTDFDYFELNKVSEHRSSTVSRQVVLSEMEEKHHVGIRRGVPAESRR